MHRPHRQHVRGGQVRGRRRRGPTLTVPMQTALWCTTNASPRCVHGRLVHERRRCKSRRLRARGIATGNTFAAAGGDATNIASCRRHCDKVTPLHPHMVTCARDWFGDNTGNAGIFCALSRARGNGGTLRASARLRTRTQHSCSLGPRWSKRDGADHHYPVDGGAT